MRMIFDVGARERHRVTFFFDKMLGRLSITVDDQTVTKSIEMVSLGLVKKWEFVVGHQEQHLVRIEKHRKLLFAGFRPQPVYGFVDGHLVMQAVA